MYGGDAGGGGGRGRIRRYQSCKIYIGPQLLELSCNEGRIGGVRVEVVGVEGRLGVGGCMGLGDREWEFGWGWGGSGVLAAALVPLCLCDKSNRWPLTWKVLSREGAANANEEEQVLR